jgi:D-alanyl-D-alanine carboxypeptidase
MTPDSLLHGGSTTKVFTAAAILLLVDREQLSLDAKIARLLPEKAIEGVPHIEEITVRQLLTHSSGIYSFNTDPKFFARFGPQVDADGEFLPFWKPEQVIAFAADPANPPVSEPGKSQVYAAINYVLLELVVEAVTKAPLPAFVLEEILEPLGLDSTYYFSEDPLRDRARGYTVDSARIRRMGLVAACESGSDGFIDSTDHQDKSDGAAGIITTMSDLVRFADALIGGDFSSDASRKLVLQSLDQARGRGGAMQLGILRASEMPYGLVALALGNGLGTHVAWAFHPDSKTVVAVGMNQFGGWNEPTYIMGTLIPAALKAVAESEEGAHK